MIEIRWHGRGGQGAFTASKILGVSASLYEGKNAMAFPSFGPERRGAPVLAFTKIADEKITDRSEIKTCDYMVFLDETLVNESLLKDIKKTGWIIINSRHPDKFKGFHAYNIITMDATSIAMEVLKRPVTNTAMLGALIGVSGIIGLQAGMKGLEYCLPPQILAKNMDVLRVSYDKVRERIQ